MTELSTAAALAWQYSWDRQQSAHLTDREHRFATMINVATATRPDQALTVLDLAGGTGSISLRVLRRLPAATTTLVDVDPVLLTIARGSLDKRTTIVSADLRDAGWVDQLPHRTYDAVLTATALHWIPEDRLTVLYREIREVLRPGGVFVNADHMADSDLPRLTAHLIQADEARTERLFATGGGTSWDGWWEHVRRDPVLGPLYPERLALFGREHALEFTPPVTWHLDALRSAGFSEVGLVWRGGPDAAVAAVH